MWWLLYHNKEGFGSDVSSSDEPDRCENLGFFIWNIIDCSEMLKNILECSRAFKNVQESSRMFF